VVVIDPADRRREALEAALLRCGQTWELLPWAEVAARPAWVGEVARAGDLLRVDSPGSDAATWRALVQRGEGASDGEPGRWRPGRAWFQGLRAVLAEIEAGAPGALLTHPAACVLDMIDKQACHARLAAAGVPVPDALEAPATPEALRAALDDVGWAGVFVKPRWGSSGAGVLAWRRGGGREQLTAPLRLEGGALVNHKRLETVTAPADIDARLAPVLADGAVVERWIPKAGARGRTFDLRVVVIDGRARHRVARLAAGPITNLHLDAERADADEILAEAGVSPARALGVCEAAARVFAGARCVGVDLGIDVRGRPFVIEVNAWGDHLRRVWHEGEDPAEAQVRAALRAAGAA
jgi:glutathione synthase/RimK-type ligase-like ATP-grasp enzyme